MLYHLIAGIIGRYKRSPLFVTLAIVSSLAMVLAACGGTGGGPSTSPGSQDPTASKYGGDLSVGITADVTTLDPAKSSSLYDRQVMLNLYDTLVRIDAQNTVQPLLASSWKYISPTELEFTLRDDVKFHDGTPFNAEAVVFNIDRIKNDKTSPRNSEIATVASVKATDATHVVFTLTTAFTPLLATLTDRAGMILSPTAIQQAGDKLVNAPTGAGSGAFMFSEWVKGDHLTLKANPNYWLKDKDGSKLPYLQSLRYRPITNSGVMFSNLQTGNIQVSDAIDGNNLPAIKSNANLTYNQIPSLGFNGFELNTKAAPFDNVHVRRAVSWAINRQEILDNALKGLGVLANGPIPPSSWAFDKSFSPYSPNVENAKRELAESGLSNVSFAMLVTSNSPINAQIAQFVQAQLEPVGIKMEIKQQTFTTILSDIDAGKFQAALVGWSGRPDPDGNMYAHFHTGGGFNEMQYSNPQVDTLLETARTATTEDDRTKAYQEAQKIIMDEAPYIFTTHPVAQQAMLKKVKNFTLLPTTILMFQAVWLEK